MTSKLAKLDKQEILNQLKIRLDHNSLNLPEYIDFTIEKSMLNVHIGVNTGKKRMSCLANMQDDEAAFEGWCICLKFHLDNYFDKVNLSWSVPNKITKSEFRHYNKFLYRVLRFRHLFPWFIVSPEHENELTTFENSFKNVRINSPEKKAGIPTSDKISEKLIEYNFYNLEFLKNKLGLESTNHQLPVGVFKNGQSLFTGGASAADIWGIDDKENFHLFELKYNNKKVGIITELLFYCEVFYDVFLSGKIKKPKNFYFLRGAEFLYANNARKISKINAYFLTDKMHSLVAGTTELLNSNSLGINFFNLEYKLNSNTSQFQKLYFKGAYQLKKEISQSIFRKKHRITGDKYFVSNGYDNLFQSIRNDAVQYFDLNQIEWWSFNKKDTIPTTHMLSSQIQCLNFLYAIRKDKNSVIKLAKLIDPEIDNVYKTLTDKDEGFLSFEFIYENKKLINETSYGGKRGKFLTSIDVFLIGRRDGKKILIPFEWKYTESYLIPENKALEPGKGQTRQARYNQLINESKQLKTQINLEQSLFYYEPYYEFMRQTLLVEKMVEKELADDFLHILVAPAENKDLLQQSYACEQQDLVETWKSQLEKPEKYKQVDSKEILEFLGRLPGYSLLYNYLKLRYE